MSEIEIIQNYVRKNNLELNLDFADISNSNLEEIVQKIEKVEELKSRYELPKKGAIIGFSFSLLAATGGAIGYAVTGDPISLSLLCFPTIFIPFLYSNNYRQIKYNIGILKSSIYKDLKKLCEKNEN